MTTRNGPPVHTPLYSVLQTSGNPTSLTVRRKDKFDLVPN